MQCIPRNPQLKHGGLRCQEREIWFVLCVKAEFEKQEGKVDSKWGFTAHKITMMIFKNCRFIMSFSKGRTIWDSE